MSRRAFILERANLVSAIFTWIFTWSFPLQRPGGLDSIDLGAMILWGLAGWCVLKFLRRLGLPVALIALVAVAVQFHIINELVHVYVVNMGNELRPWFWSEFWLSVAPLILGGFFAAFAFWGSHTKRLRRAKDGNDEVKQPLIAR
ncbi:hypothetical protein N9Y81_04485 [Akkermansiaceae bacterium]|jgi:predicted cobalt transporter CbtA|nr:hypothetical protein [Akkermansiaceae bacterium]